MSKSTVATALAATLAAACGASSPAPDETVPAPAELTVDVVTSAEQAGAVNSILVAGPTELIIVDAQFTRSGAEAVADRAAATGKRVAAVFITHAHPDHYLGTAILTRRFPGARVIATADVVAEMQASAAATAASRKQMLGPEFPGEPVIPEPVDHLAVDGVELELLTDLAGDTHPITGVMVPGGTLIASDVAYADVHPWTATTDHDGRTRWAAETSKLAALPGLHRVIPGHQLASSKPTADSLGYTRRYILDFDRASSESADAAALIDTMAARYPVGARIFLEIGAQAAFSGR